MNLLNRSCEELIMPEFGKVLWEAKTQYLDKSSAEGAETFEFFFNYCSSKLPSQNLTKSFQLFSQEKNRLHEESIRAIGILSQEPFLIAFLVWIKESELSAPDRLNAKALLENGFIGITDNNGQIWTIAKAKNFDHRNVIDAIRCRRDWTFLLRENLVRTYLNFIQWLSAVTYGYLNLLEDPDLERCQNRSVAYMNFIHFLSKLKDEDQLVAKLLYFGGSRTLEEILNLTIEKVDFLQRRIHFGLQPVPYPLHVFADIQEIIQGRKKGKIFTGRRGEGTFLNPATIFRNFKEAAIAIGFEKNFTPKMLTQNI